MLSPVADGVWIHRSDFCRSNGVVVQGRSGVLVVDPGVRSDEIACLAADLRESGQSVVAGFSTHPHWDHLLWHPLLGAAPRYGTGRCAAAIAARLSDPSWPDFVAALIPTDIVEQVPLELFGRITGLPADATRLPWDGPPIRIVEHQAHATGHAALLIEDRRVLVAGDMVSDVLIPMLDLTAADDPIEGHLAALRLLEATADDVDVVVPGHGSVGTVDQFRARIAQDRTYLHALRDTGAPTDPRIGPAATFGTDWLPGVHERQRERLARRTGPGRDPAPR